MSVALDRLHRAHAHLEEALQELTAAHEAVPDEEFDATLPSLLVCGYNPPAKQGSFTLLGHVSPLAEALEKVLADPGHAPFRDALLEAMERRLLTSILD